MPNRNEEERIDANEVRADSPEEANAQRGGSEVKQGLHGQSTREAARGRKEFAGNGDQARLDEGRAEAAGRHYGRSGSEEPGPGYGKGELQPDEGEAEAPKRSAEAQPKK